MRSKGFFALACLVTASVPCEGASLCFVDHPVSGANTSQMCRPDSALAVNRCLGFTTDGTGCTTDLECVTSDVPPPEEGCWTVSASPSDPYANWGELEPGPTELYLWALHGTDYGFTRSKFGLSGEIAVLSVTATGGFLLLPDGDDEPGSIMLESPACGVTPTVAAFLTVEGVVGVDGGSWGQMKASYR